MRKAPLKVICAGMALLFATVSVAAVAGVPASAPAPLAPVSAAPAVSTAAKEATIGLSCKKTETVYVNLDPSGKPREQIVTDWLHTGEANVTVEDRTTLDDVINIKSVEGPQRDGSALTWKMDGTDLYYRGKASGKLPIELEISYSLDGKRMKPEQMAGQSGRVQIDLKFRNTNRNTVRIGGKNVTMYTPAMAVVAMTLPDDKFSNVSVSDGTVQTDGNNQAVALIAMPGMEQNLDLERYDIPGFEDLDFPEEFTVTADVTEFEMGPIMIVMTTEIPDLDEIDAQQDIREMKADMYDLRDMQNNLDAADPNHRTRSLFTDEPITEGARTMIDDIFDFYDLDTTVLDILPKYITDENIDLYDRVWEDMDKVDIDDLLDSDAINDMIHQMSKKNIEKIRDLLDDYDTIEDLDCKDLDKLCDQAIEMLDAMQDNKEQVETFKVLLKYSDAMVNLAKSLDNPAVEQYLTPENMRVAVKAVAENEINKLALMIPQSGTIDPGVQSAILSQIKPYVSAQEYAALEALLSSDMGASQGSRDSSAPAELTIGSEERGTIRRSSNTSPVDHAFWDGYDEEDEEDEEDGDLTVGESGEEHASRRAARSVTLASGGPTNYQTLMGILQSKRDAIAGQKADEVMAQLTPALQSISQLKGAIVGELGGAEKAKERLQKAAAFTEALLPKVHEIVDTAEKLSDRIGGPESRQLQYLLGEMRDMLDDLDENRDNIKALQRVMREYDSDKFQDFRDNYGSLKQSFNDARPILRDLRRDLDDPAMDKSLHESPKTVDVLLNMKNDLLANRNVSEILRDAVAPQSSNLMASVFNLFDVLQDKGAVDKYTGQVEDLDELIERKDALVDLADAYRIYTDAPEYMETDLKFIMKTDEIKIPEVEEAPAPVEEKKGFGEWIKGLLKK